VVRMHTLVSSLTGSAETTMLQGSQIVREETAALVSPASHVMSAGAVSGGSYPDIPGTVVTASR
jgi:hypothetical protein